MVAVHDVKVMVVQIPFGDVTQPEFGREDSGHSLEEFAALRYARIDIAEGT